MQARIVAAARRPDLGLLEQHLMVIVVERIIRNCGLVWLAKTVAVFVHAGLDVMLRGLNIDLTTRARHTIDATQQHRISCILYRPEELLDYFG